MSEIIFEEMDIVKTWCDMCSSYHGVVTSFQSLEGNFYSAICLDMAGNYQIYGAKEKSLLFAEPEVEGTVQSNQICDLNEEGERWEGEALNSVPYGWGQLYTKDNQLAYEGFMFGDVKTLRGRYFHTNIGVIKYEGTLCNGEYMGNGKLLGVEGDVIYDGLWLYGHQMDTINSIMTKDKKLLALHNQITSFTFCNRCDIPPSKLLITNFPLLKDMIIVGTQRFDYRITDYGDGSLVVAQCPNLESMRFVTNSCPSIKKFVCRDCPKLKFIAVAGGFRFGSHCLIEDLPELQTIDLHNGVFGNAESIVIQRLPKLHKLRFEEFAFNRYFYDSDEEEAYKSRPLTGTLVLRDLPTLDNFTIERGVGERIGHVIVENVNFPEIEGYGERLENAFDVQTNNPAFLKFMLENNVVLYKTVSYPYDLSKDLEVMNIQYYSGNDRDFTTLSIDNYPKLTQIDIGFRSFSFATKVQFTNNPALQSISIGKHCFDGVENGSFMVKHCPKLELLSIEGCVASAYTVFEIEDVPMLQVFKAGRDFCRKTKKFVLKDLPMLTTVELQEQAFQDVNEVRFENLPNFKSLEIGYATLYGDLDHGDNPNYLYLINLPELVKMDSHSDWAFQEMTDVYVKDVPKLKGDDIWLCAAFKYTKNFTCESFFFL